MGEFLDARRRPDDGPTETDVCVVGGGVAGITVARELIGGGRRVLILEAGGDKPGGKDQALADGDIVGLPYTRPDQTRTFGLGGTSAIWTGWCRPLDALDFEARDAVPHSGWPFGKAELDPFYERAQGVCEIGPYAYDAAAWASDERAVLPVDAHKIASPVFQFSPPTHWGRRYADALRRAENVAVLRHAHVTRLELDAPGRRVTAAHVGTRNGKRFEVRATTFVLAAGGIANPCLLLNSDTQEPAGLGNTKDLVGRYFADHPYLNASTLVLDDVDTSLRLYEGEPANRHGYDGKVLALLSLSESARREAGVVNCVWRFPEAFKTHRAFASPAVWSLNQLVRHAKQGALPYRWPAHVGALLRDPVSVATVIGRKLTMKSHPPARRRPLRVFLESAPNPDSRVTLSERRDALGRRVPRIDWRLSELDRRSLCTAHEILDAAVRAAGIGHVETNFDLNGDWTPHLQHGHHPLGTTRMHDDPRRGVVNNDGRVHGTDNLFVAGSSVFPTAGSANPTLTIVALALRLADRLRALR